MAFLDKFKFWKRKEPEFDFGKPGDELGLGGPAGTDEFGLPKSAAETTPPGLSTPRPAEEEFRPQLSGFAPPTAQQGYQQQGYSPQTSMPGRSRDMEIALAKLDAIKALLDSVDHRMAILEQSAKEQKPNRSKYDYY